MQPCTKRREVLLAAPWPDLNTGLRRRGLACAAPQDGPTDASGDAAARNGHSERPTGVQCLLAAQADSLARCLRIITMCVLAQSVCTLTHAQADGIAREPRAAARACAISRVRGVGMTRTGQVTRKRRNPLSARRSARRRRRARLRRAARESGWAAMSMSCARARTCGAGVGAGAAGRGLPPGLRNSSARFVWFMHGHL
jgi:hypothetical protein